MRAKEYIKHGVMCALCCAFMWGCASIGNPSGGARDEDPPRFVSASPAPGAVNVDSTDLNISITFDELVNVKNAFEKVVLSPPGKSVPRVTTRGRRILINNTDTLLPNTTYTIDFGDAIEDNNEGNILSGFSYTFSTGSVLDSLRISGMVLGAEDMEPQQGVFVGAYTSDADSVFLKKPFDRLARTDEMGRFVLRGLRDTNYRLFALKDLDNDKHFANPEEDIAWYADTIRPTSERIETQDTIRDLYTGAVDTIVARQRTRFLPNNVLLRMFNTGVKPQYLVSYARPDSTKLSFIFNAPSERRPLVRLADDEVFPDPLAAEANIGNDSLTFFLPQEIAMRDTLRLAIEYVNTDVATGTPRLVNDTVKLTKPKVEKKKEKEKKKKKKDEEEEEEEKTPPPPTFKFQATGPDRDITQPIRLEAPVPLASLDTLGFRLEAKAEGDTVWANVKKEYRLQRQDTLSERRFKIEYPWERGMSYRLSADSLSATDIYGVGSDKLQLEFKTKPEDEVSNLKFTLNGLENGIPAFVQLMSGGDKVSYTAKVENGVADFRGIDGGKYYARVYEDFDGDGKYSPGSYRLQRVYGIPSEAPLDSLALRGDSIEMPRDSVEMLRDSVIPADRRPLTDRETVERLVRMGYSLEPLENDSTGTDILIAIQPDLVYYYPKIINVKKAWDIDQAWDVFETALDLQKPLKIKKNKPKRNNNDQTRQQEDEEEDEDDMFGNPFNPNDRNNRNNRNQTGGLRKSF